MQSYHWFFEVSRGKKWSLCITSFLIFLSGALNLIAMLIAGYHLIEAMGVIKNKGDGEKKSEVKRIPSYM